MSHDNIMALTSVTCYECMGGNVHDGQGHKTAFCEPPPFPFWSLSYGLKPFPLPPPEPGSLNNSFGLHLFSGLLLLSQICKNHPKLKKREMHKQVKPCGQPSFFNLLWLSFCLILQLKFLLRLQLPPNCQILVFCPPTCTLCSI